MVNDLTRAHEPSHVIEARDLLIHSGSGNSKRGRWRQSLSAAKRYQRQLLREALAKTLH